MTKEYTVSDLFFTQWSELPDQTRSEVYSLYLKLQAIPMDAPEYGFFLLGILRALRRNISLVDQLAMHGNPEMVVDIFNDLVFLKEPWFSFPSFPIEDLTTPSAELARATFDHFTYADQEFTVFILTQDEARLERLVATLYQRTFDPEDVQSIAEALNLAPWQYNLVFFTYLHVRDKIVKRAPTLLPKVKASEDGGTSQQSSGPMWHRLKHELARTGVFGTFEQVGKANVYAVIDHLEILAKERDERQRRK